MITVEELVSNTGICYYMYDGLLAFIPTCGSKMCRKKKKLCVLKQRVSAVVTEVFGVSYFLIVTQPCIKQYDFAFLVSLHGWL